jgi:signal transduction histidine kinase/ActR/RegA family two-component response regulator
MAAVASAIMVGFIVYNFADFPPGIREPMVAHDAVTAAVCALVWWLIRAGRIHEDHAHAVATGLILLVASNILLAMWLLRAPYQAIYLCILIVGAGAGMTSIVWGAAVVVMLGLASVPVLFAVADATTVARYLAMMAATSAIAMALIALRARNLRELAHLTELDRQQRAALNEALADLDAKVAQRTAELQAANAALQTQMDERARAEKEARLLAEQLLHAQRLESLGRLAGGVAHDFNNLLTVIEGNLHLSLDDLPAGAEREPLEDAIGASERAAKLTKQLLAFSRKQVIERSMFDAGQHVEDVSRMLQRVLGEGIELHVATSGPDLWVNADPNQIEQVLMNLTANARDAMPDGGACHIEVGRASAAGQPFVRIRVRDTGIGMDAPTLERLFEPFFTTKGPGDGTGLGLSTAYGVVQQHGGSITVHSSPGAGATFDVLLPAVDATVRTSPEAVASIAPSSGKETVLLVEDEDAVRRVAERFLRRQGYDVLVASGGAEALVIAATAGRPLALLFTDVMMPGMNGFELAEQLRRLQPEIKVLFVSGYTGDYLQTQTGELPAGTHFLYKPYQLSRTAQMIREILDEHAVDVA